MYVSNNLHISPKEGKGISHPGESWINWNIDWLAGNWCRGWRLLPWHVRGRTSGGSRASGGLEITRPGEVRPLLKWETPWEWKKFFKQPTFQSSIANTSEFMHVPRDRRRIQSHPGIWSEIIWFTIIIIKNNMYLYKKQNIIKMIEIRNVEGRKMSPTLPLSKDNFHYNIFPSILMCLHNLL